MIFEYKEPDIDLLIKCLIENGCTVRKAKDGEGGIYLRGKKLTDEELMDCIMHPWEDSDMSVLINGMEMPKSCLSCPLQGGTADCRLTQKTYNWGLTERPSDCPLIPVPPHGRLIDADAPLRIEIIFDTGTGETKTSLFADTIIEA